MYWRTKDEKDGYKVEEVTPCEWCRRWIVFLSPWELIRMTNYKYRSNDYLIRRK